MLALIASHDDRLRVALEYKQYMAITYAAALLNEFGFPHLSELSICGAPEMHEPPTYLQILILNQTLVAAYPLPARKLISMFGRRVEAAITEYRKGRYLLIDYVNALPKPHHKLDTILRSATHFEQCVGLTTQASFFRKRIQTMEKKEIKSIGPVEDRLKKVWNRAKHFDEDILEADSIDTITAPVWLTADGICSQDGKAPGVVVSVAWKELHTLLLQYQEDLKYFCETRINEFVATQASSGQPQE